MKFSLIHALTAGLAALGLQACFEPSGPATERGSQAALAAAVAQPNLRFTAARITAHTANGVEYAYTLQNNGTAAIADIHDITLQNKYSPTTDYNDPRARVAGGTSLGVHQSLAAGASYNGTYRTGTPQTGGMNHLVFKIDAGGIIAESNETDNTRALSLVPGVLPDLVITSAAVTSRTATRTHFTYTLKNNGPGHIPGLAHLGVQCYYSANTVYGDAGDVAAGGGPIGVDEPLAAGASRTLTDYAVGAPPAGKPYLVFKVDESGALFETNEGNNTRALRVTP